jgi:predicted RNA methylase
MNDLNKYIEAPNELLAMMYNQNNVKPNDFYGDTLFVGMGNLYFQTKISVDSITIIEKYADVIELQKNNILPEWIIIQDDGYIFTTDKKFDVIMLDMWYEMIPEEELNEQINRYKKFLKKDGKVIYLETIKI